MASYPTFNPNAYNAGAEIARRNRAVQDIYEPGSTFKVVTVAAALEENVMPLNSYIDTNPGVIRFAGSVVDEYGGRNYGVAVVHRRHRQIEQHRRDQDRPQGRARADGHLHEPLRVWSSHLA